MKLFNSFDTTDEIQDCISLEYSDIYCLGEHPNFFLKLLEKLYISVYPTDAAATEGGSRYTRINSAALLSLSCIIYLDGGIPIFSVNNVEK